MPNKIKEIVNDYVKEKMKLMKKDYYKIQYELNNDLYKEVSNMYDAFIDQFYSYKTTSYIRHGERMAGTCVGSSLYRANDIKTGGNYFKPKLIINFTPEEINEKYQYDSQESIFNYVMHGIRFPYYNSMKWRGNFKGKYFEFSGTPSHAFQLFDAQFDDIAEREFRKRWKNTNWGN